MEAITQSPFYWILLIGCVLFALSGAISLASKVMAMMHPEIVNNIKSDESILEAELCRIQGESYESSLDRLQADLFIWQMHNFPETFNASNMLLGVTEEVGELCHAMLKGIQGIRHRPEDIYDMKRDAVGDIIIYLMNFCSASDIQLSDAIKRAWNEVRFRDWKKYPLNGVSDGVQQKA